MRRNSKPSIPKRRKRPPIEVRNIHLREQLDRRRFDLEFAQAEKNQLEEQNESLRRENAELHRQNEELKDKLRHLQDLLRPRAVQSQRKALEFDQQKIPKKVGAKPGHPAHVRTVPEKIDVHVDLVPDHCPGCHRKLPKPSQWHSHTQTDLPGFVQPITTQYHVGWCYCRHCKQSVSIADADKIPRTKYGSKLHAQIGYWKFGLGLTLPKIQQCLRDSYNLEISTGELSEMLSSDAAKFFSSYETLKPGLRKEKLVYADETSWRRAGKGAWLWSFSSEKLSYYTIEKGRSKDVVQATLGEHFDGILSSDFLGSYTALDCQKQKCWAHLLRELHNLKDKYPANKEVVRFADGARRFYDRAIALARKKARHQKAPRALARLINDTDRFAAKRWKNMELKTLARRMHYHRDGLYTFIRAGIPPNNNAAEREIRPAVLMRKTSYGNRSDRGAQAQSIWMSLIRTCRKQDKPFLEIASNYLKSA